MKLASLLFISLVSSFSWAGISSVSSLKVAIPSSTVESGNRIRSFRDWKSAKIEVAKSQAQQSRVRLQALKTKGKSANVISAIRNMEQQLSQEEWNLEVAKDLSVTDYLVLYLAQQGAPGRLTEAASKLMPDEIAQLLESYLNSVGAIQTEGKALLPTSALQTR